MTLMNDELTQWTDWTPPKYFLHYRVNIGKADLIIERRESVVPDIPINLCLSFTLNLWVRYHC